MKSYKKSSCDKLYLIGSTLYEKMLPLLNDVEKQEIIDLNEEHKDGVVEKFKSKRFPCGGCTKAFTSKMALKRHFKTFHMPECCKYYNARKLHTTPENTETPQTSAKKYSRQACDKSYTQSSSLKTHILTFHRGQKYSCQACDKSFTRYHALKTHIQKVHEGLKLPQSSAGIKNEFTPDEVDRMTPNVENETLKKPKWTRGQKRKKSMPQGKIFKQIHLEALLDALNSEFGL